MEGKLPLAVSSDDEETSEKGKQINKPCSTTVPVLPAKRIRPELIPMVNCNSTHSSST